MGVLIAVILVFVLAIVILLKMADDYLATVVTLLTEIRNNSDNWK
jgi:hypothetical protein